MTNAAFLQPYVDNGTIAGAVTLVASVDAVISHDAVGWATIGVAPMRRDSMFWIASITKPITATCLMMLVDAGRIRIEDPVEAYLPEFSGQMLAVEQDAEHAILRKPARPITVRDVLAHTSGLPFNTRPEAGKIDRLTLREAAISYALSPLGFEPGTRYAYSNGGTNTAGRLIEAVSGIAYWDFLRTRLLEPLGMRDTTFWPDAAQLGRLATAYQPNADRTALAALAIEQCSYPLDARSRHPSPAGGLFSTAEDLWRFARMVLAGGMVAGARLLTESAVRQMTSRQTGALENCYGLGWAVDPAGQGFGHGGAYSTDLWIDTVRGRALVYLVQHNGYGGSDGAAILPAFRKLATAISAR
ncbi:MAG: beta-lactamase family protein [Planctomycetes bacterium]|nr:beta-lactamase family protein [Planctomycetota bacterium]